MICIFFFLLTVSSYLIGLKKNYPYLKFQLKVEESQFYGSVSLYTPLRPWPNLGGIPFDQTNSSFLYQIEFTNNYILLAYCSYELEQQQITHYYLFYQDKILKFKEAFQLNALAYEGNYTYHYFQYNSTISQLTLSISNNNKVYIKNIQYFYLDITKNQNVTFGGSYPLLGLASFPGSLDFSLGDDNPYEEDYYTQLLSTCEYQENIVFFDQIQYSGSFYQVLTPDPLVYYDYSIQFWNRITSMQYEKNSLIQLFRINQQQRKDSEIQIGQDAFQLEFVFISTEIAEIFIYYYSYNFPAINVQKEYVLSLIEKQKMGEISTKNLFQWHIIQVWFLSQQLFTKIIHPNQLTVEYQSEKIKQFSFSQFTFIFGKDSQSQFTGEIAFLEFYSCYQELKVEFSCHYSCQTCDGPFKQNCLSCSSDSKRIYNENEQTCTCQPWTLENNETKCYEQIQNIQYIKINTLEGYDQIEPEVICSFGYFLYNDQCYQCPSSGLQMCYQCLADWKNWINYCNCYEDVFQILFIIVDEQLLVCDNCVFYCQTNTEDCNQYALNHLNKPTFVYCKYGYDTKNQLCLGYKQVQLFGNICNDFCLDCQLGECYQCKENMTLLLNKKDCQQCTIKHCLRCFSYTYEKGIPISSLATLSFTNPLEISDDQIIGCAQCKEGYIFDQVENLCKEQLNIQPNCLNYYFNEQGLFICLSTTKSNFEEGIEINLCQNLIQFCQKCIRFVSEKILCTQCQDGYYINQNFLCDSCPINSQNCYLNYQNQYWIIPIQAFFISFQKFTNFFQLDQLYTNLIVNCKQNYYSQTFQSQICTEIPKNQYCQSYQGRYCSSCITSNDLTFPIKYYQSQCFQCFHQCITCVPKIVTGQDIQYQLVQLTNFGWQDNRCLETNETENYIQQNIGYVRSKHALFERYETIYNFSLTENDFQDILEDKIQIDYLKVIQPEIIQINIITIRPTVIVNQFFGQFDSLREANLIYENQEIFYSNKIVDFTKVIFSNIAFPYYKQLHISNISISSFKLIELIFYNTSVFFDSHIYYDLYTFITVINCSNFYISNMYLNSIEGQRVKLFYIDISNTDFSIFKLENLIISNCKITNGTLFEIQSSLDKLIQVQIKNLSIINCTFENTEILSISENLLLIQVFQIFEIKIENTDLINVNFLAKVSSETDLIIRNFQIINTSLVISILFKVDFNIKLSNFYSFNSIFNQSEILMLQNTKIKNNVDIQIIHFDNVKFQQTHILLINQHLERITIKNLTMKSCEYSLFEYYQNSLFDIAAKQVFISNYQAINSIIHHFQINSSNYLEIYEVYLDNFNLLQQLHHTNRNDQNIHSITFLSCINLANVKLKNIFTNKISVKDSILFNFQELNQLASIQAENLNFNSTLILQTSKEYSASIIWIMLQQRSQIHFKNFSITNTFGIQRIDNLLYNQIQLVLIRSELSYAQIYDISLINNFIANSSTALINLELLNIKFLNILNINSNVITNQIYNVLLGNYKEINLQALLFIFPIKSYGSLFKIKCNTLIIQNLSSLNSSAKIGGLGYLIFIQEGQFYLADSEIQNSYTNQNENSQGGTFYVDSTLGNLNLEFIRVMVNSSFSLISGGFLFIRPSANQNQIKLSNLKFYDIISFSRSILSSEFISFKQNNTMILTNLILICTQEGILRFSSQYPLGNLDSMSNISFSEGGIYVKNSKFIADNIYLNYEIIHEPLFSLQANDLRLLEIRVFFIQLRIPQIFTIIGLETEQLFKIKIVSTTIIQNTDTRKINLEKLLNCQKYIQIEISFGDSILLIPELFSYNCLLQFWSNQLNNIDSQLLYISSNSRMKNNIVVSNLVVSGIRNINYTQKIIYINVSYQSFIKFDQLYFLNNICSQSSCLLVNLNYFNSQSLFVLKNSKLINNSHSLNGTIQTFQINQIIKQSIFIKNYAQEYGAALNLQSNQIQIIQDCFFIENTAGLFGGAILAKKLTQQIQNNYFLRNQGVVGMSSFGVQSFELNLVVSTANNSFVLNKQSMGQIILIFPSGQKLFEYKKFDKINLNYEKVATSYSIIFTNQFQEKQFFFDISKRCQFRYEIIPDNFQQVSNQYFFESLEFNDLYEINLNELIIVKNPYESTLVKADLSCQQYDSDNRSISFYFKTYHCQLGEILFENSCIKCDGKQGYYSFNPLEGSCVKVNTIKIKNNTENQLDLNLGYWRPEIFSPYISECQNKKENCLGGWQASDSTCSPGHIGALCEECDLYNIRGNGSFSRLQNYECSICGSSLIIITKLLTISFWIILQINLAVKNTQFQNQKFLMLKTMSKHFIILFKKYQEQSGTLFKLIMNYFQVINLLQIASTELNYQFGQFFDFFGNQTFSISYDLNCIIYQLSSINIIYLNSFVMILLPTLYFILYLILAKIIHLLQLGIFSIESIYCSIFYLALSAKASYVNQLLQLAIPRKISETSWISLNIANKYFTKSHQQFLLIYILPMLAFFSLLLPSVLAIILVGNKKINNMYHVKQKFGYLLNDYKQSKYYWELIKLQMKEVMMFIYIMFQEETLMGLCFQQLLFQVYYYFLNQIKPYSLEPLNQYEKKLLTLLQLLLFLSLLQISSKETTTIIYQICQILKLIILMVFIYISLKKLIINFTNKYSMIFDRIKMKINNQISKLNRNKKVYFQIKYLETRSACLERVQKNFLRIHQIMKSGVLTSQSQFKLQKQPFSPRYNTSSETQEVILKTATARSLI